MKRIWLLLVFLSVFSVLFGQEEVATFMQYNLLNYRNYTSFCDGTNNSALAKEDYLKTIVQYVDPDILVCNEIGNSPSNTSKILDRCLNVDGVTKYAQASYTATPGADLINMLYYNKEMFSLKGQDQITKDINNQTLVRLIDVYFLYYNDPGFPLVDTTFITIFVAHLKAGNTSSDAAARDRATQALMKYISDNNISDNYVLMGDFNVYSASDAAFDNLVNGSYRFYDPANAMGNWNNNSGYASVHTQSTRLNNTNGGCFSGGGLDDRFDFILMSKAVKDDENRVEYIKNSYKALGNDGNHFNGNIKVPANTSVPANVLNALYEMSDHLPVKMDVLIEQAKPNSVNSVAANGLRLRVVNPTASRIVFYAGGRNADIVVRLFSITGALVSEQKVTVSDGQRIDMGQLDVPGVYLLEFTDEYGNRQVERVIVSR